MLLKAGIVMEIKERNLNIDIIKFFALLFVISIHFFLYTDFYNIPVMGTKMFYAVILRTLFNICISLFLLISGYLLYKRDLTPSPSAHYKKIIKILLPYFILTVITAVIKVNLIKYGYYDDKIDFTWFIKGFFDFDLIKYAWYLELYVGLFLLMPFINKMLTNKKNDTILLCVFIGLTILSTITHKPVIWLDYYKDIAPLTFYLTGAYIAKYGINIKFKQNLLLFLTALFIVSIYNYIYNYGRNFFMMGMSDWITIENYIVAVLFFLLFINREVKTKNKLFVGIITNIAKLAIGVHLSTYIFDTIIYHNYRAMAGYIPVDMKYMLIIVPAVYICSILLANVVSIIEKLIYKIFNIKFYSASKVNEEKSNPV